MGNGGWGFFWGGGGIYPHPQNRRSEMWNRLRDIDTRRECEQPYSCLRGGPIVPTRGRLKLRPFPSSRDGKVRVSLTLAAFERKPRVVPHEVLEDQALDGYGVERCQSAYDYPFVHVGVCDSPELFPCIYPFGLAAPQESVCLRTDHDMWVERVCTDAPDGVRIGRWGVTLTSRTPRKVWLSASAAPNYVVVLLSVRRHRRDVLWPDGYRVHTELKTPLLEPHDDMDPDVVRLEFDHDDHPIAVRRVVFHRRVGPACVRVDAVVSAHSSTWNAPALRFVLERGKRPVCLACGHGPCRNALQGVCGRLPTMPVDDAYAQTWDIENVYVATTPAGRVYDRYGLGFRAVRHGARCANVLRARFGPVLLPSSRSPCTEQWVPTVVPDGVPGRVSDPTFVSFRIVQLCAWRVRLALASLDASGRGACLRVCRSWFFTVVQAVCTERWARTRLSCAVTLLTASKDLYYFSERVRRPSRVTIRVCGDHTVIDCTNRTPRGGRTIVVLHNSVQVPPTPYRYRCPRCQRVVPWSDWRRCCTARHDPPRKRRRRIAPLVRRVRVRCVYEMAPGPGGGAPVTSEHGQVPATSAPETRNQQAPKPRTRGRNDQAPKPGGASVTRENDQAPAPGEAPGPRRSARTDRTPCSARTTRAPTRGTRSSKRSCVRQKACRIGLRSNTYDVRVHEWLYKKIHPSVVTAFARMDLKTPLPNALVEKYGLCPSMLVCAVRESSRPIDGFCTEDGVVEGDNFRYFLKESGLKNKMKRLFERNRKLKQSLFERGDFCDGIFKPMEGLKNADAPFVRVNPTFWEDACELWKDEAPCK